MKFSDAINIITEEEYFYNSLANDKQEELYQVFKKTYEQATGGAFSKEDFEWRASNWTFYGIGPEDPKKCGGIAVRKQRSNDMYKLVASFGNFRGIASGTQELLSKHGSSSIWGAMTPQMASMLERFTNGEFVELPAMAVKILGGIFSKVSSGVKEVNNDGTIKVNTPSGEMNKTIVCNKVYIQWLIDAANNPSINLPVPKVALAPIIGSLKKLL